jgi:hypothetical protein
VATNGIDRRIAALLSYGPNPLAPIRVAGPRTPRGRREPAAAFNPAGPTGALVQTRASSSDDRATGRGLAACAFAREEAPGAPRTIAPSQTRSPRRRPRGDRIRRKTRAVALAGRMPRQQRSDHRWERAEGVFGRLREPWISSWFPRGAGRSLSRPVRFAARKQVSALTPQTALLHPLGARGVGRRAVARAASPVQQRRGSRPHSGRTGGF